MFANRQPYRRFGQGSRVSGVSKSKLLTSDRSRIPPFWIGSTDDQDRSIDPRVYEIAERMWPWAFRHVERELNDGPIAAETLEDVAIAVSSRLRSAPEVGRNINGYLATAFHRSVRARRIREGRLALEGLGRELEKNHSLRCPDSIAALEWRLTLDLLLALLRHEIKHTLHLRMLGFSWKEISEVRRLSVRQVKSRYYRGLQNAFEELKNSQFRRLAESEDSD